MANIPKSEEDFRKIADQKASEMLQRIIDRHLGRRYDIHSDIGLNITNPVAHHKMALNTDKTYEEHWVDSRQELRKYHLKAESKWIDKNIYQRFWVYLKHYTKKYWDKTDKDFRNV